MKSCKIMKLHSIGLLTQTTSQEYILSYLLFSAVLKPRGHYLDFWQADLGYIGQAIIGVKVPNSSHVAFIQHWRVISSLIVQNIKPCKLFLKVCLPPEIGWMMGDEVKEPLIMWTISSFFCEGGNVKTGKSSSLSYIISYSVYQSQGGSKHYYIWEHTFASRALENKQTLLR